jgi:hypothetical protein
MGRKYRGGNNTVLLLYEDEDDDDDDDDITVHGVLVIFYNRVRRFVGR